MRGNLLSLNVVGMGFGLFSMIWYLTLCGCIVVGVSFHVCIVEF